MPLAGSTCFRPAAGPQSVLVSHASSVGVAELGGVGGHDDLVIELAAELAAGDERDLLRIGPDSSSRPEGANAVDCLLRPRAPRSRLTTMPKDDNDHS